MLADVVHSGRLADLILVLMAIEGLVLGCSWLVLGRGIPLGDLAANLTAGACLVAALRAVLTGEGAQTIAYWLAAALVAHIADVAHRWR